MYFSRHSHAVLGRHIPLRGHRTRPAGVDEQPDTVTAVEATAHHRQRRRPRQPARPLLATRPPYTRTDPGAGGRGLSAAAAGRWTPSLVWSSPTDAIKSLLKFIFFYYYSHIDGHLSANGDFSDSIKYSSIRIVTQIDSLHTTAIENFTSLSVVSYRVPVLKTYNICTGCDITSSLNLRH